MSNDVVALDISHWQGSIDFFKVRQSQPELVGIIMKATEGVSVTDSMYLKNREAAEAAGFSVATYHYFQPGRPEEQMSHYLAFASPVAGERVVIDFEEPDCTIEDLICAVDYIHGAMPDLQITVYGASILTEAVEAYEGDLSSLKQTSLWAARFSSTEPVIATKVWPTWSLWQFTDSGQVDGIDGDVDMNRFNGSNQQAAEWFGPASKGLLPDQDERMVSIAIETDPGVRVTVIVNGQEL